MESVPFSSVHETIHEEDEENGSLNGKQVMPSFTEESTQTDVPVSIIKYPYFSDSMLPAPMISHLVLKFLVQNNFKQAANVFSQESGISFNDEQDKTLREAVTALKFDEAISHVRATYFTLLASRRVQLKRSNYVNRLKSGK